MEKTLARPLRKMFLNVTSLKSFRLVKYLCRGEIDLTQPSISSVRQYKKELYMHFDNLLYLADDVLTVLLWRGRIEVTIPKPKFLMKRRARKRIRAEKKGERKSLLRKKAEKSYVVEKEVRFVDSVKNMDGTENNHDLDGKSVMQISLWFPIRSMFLFQTVILMIERPRLIPGLCFCYVGMILCHFMVARYVNVRTKDYTAFRNFIYQNFVNSASMYLHILFHLGTGLRILCPGIDARYDGSFSCNFEIFLDSN